MERRGSKKASISRRIACCSQSGEGDGDGRGFLSTTWLEHQPIRLERWNNFFLFVSDASFASQKFWFIYYYAQIKSGQKIFFCFSIKILFEARVCHINFNTRVRFAIALSQHKTGRPTDNSMMESCLAKTSKQKRQKADAQSSENKTHEFCFMGNMRKIGDSVYIKFAVIFSLVFYFIYYSSPQLFWN